MVRLLATSCPPRPPRCHDRGMRADEPMNRTSSPAKRRARPGAWKSAGKLAAEAKWPETVDEYQRLLDEAGDDLVPLNPHHSIQARWLCHLRLAALPPAALRLYRDRIDEQAKKWLEQGTAARDPHLLRRVVEEAFCSRATEPGARHPRRPRLRARQLRRGGALVAHAGGPRFHGERRANEAGGSDRRGPRLPRPRA